MIEVRDGYAVDPERCNLHACWVESDFLPGWTVFLYDVNAEMQCLSPMPAHAFTLWGAKRLARDMLAKRLDPKVKPGTLLERFAGFASVM